MRDVFTFDDPREQRRSHNWYHFKEWGFTIMAPPKCGSSAIKQFIWMNELEDSVDALKHHQVSGDTYVVVRDPISRFCSLWRNKCRNKGNIRSQALWNFTPEDLMTHIEAGHSDVHWTPQTDMIANLTPTLIPLALLNFWWKQSGFGSLGVFNSTEGEVEISDELKARIQAFYAADVLLHNQAELDFCWDTIYNSNKNSSL